MKLDKFNEFQAELSELFSQYGVQLPEFAAGVVINDEGCFVTDFEIPVSYNPEDATE